MSAVRFDFVARFDFAGAAGTSKLGRRFKRTPSNGLLIPAFVSRAGVLTYETPTGTRRELRAPEEVLSSDSVRSFDGCPVTVLHPVDGELVTPATWRALAVGALRDPHVDGERIGATLAIEDAETIARIEAGDLVECSAGYSCSIEETSGTYNAEHYDSVQRNVRANHCAIGPRNWGRAGKSISLRIDGGAERGRSMLDDVIEANARFHTRQREGISHGTGTGVHAASDGTIEPWHRTIGPVGGTADSDDDERDDARRLSTSTTRRAPARHDPRSGRFR